VIEMVDRAQDTWRESARCRDEDPDRLFVRGALQRKARAICGGCPVRPQCLAEALDNRIEFGVWGGLTERERRALLRRRPDVTSWFRLLVEPGRAGLIPAWPRYDESMAGQP
jgi:WhiB family redox-sensing transcriptional regulator